MLELWLIRHLQTIWNALFGTTSVTISVTRLRFGEVKRVAKTVVSLNNTAHLLGTGLEYNSA